MTSERAVPATIPIVFSEGLRVVCINTDHPEWLNVGCEYVIRAPSIERNVGWHVVNLEGKYIDVKFGQFMPQRPSYPYSMGCAGDEDVVVISHPPWLRPSAEVRAKIDLQAKPRIVILPTNWQPGSHLQAVSRINRRPLSRWSKVKRWLRQFV